MRKNNKQLQNYLGKLKHAAQLANANYQIWWIYKHDREKYIDVMDQYEGFFACSIHAHFLAMLTALCRLYEDRGDTVNLKNFIELIEADGVLSADKVRLLKSPLSLMSGEIKKIKTIKNNVFSHSNPVCEYEQLIKDQHIKYNDFRDLVGNAFDILNEVSLAISKQDVRPYAFAEHATRELLDALPNYKEEQGLKKRSV